MHASKDYYRILEVHPKASPEMIDRAKRLLLQRYHPDKDPHRQDWASEQTRRVLEAHAVLSDPAERQRYDAQRRRPDVSPGSPPQHKRSAATTRRRQPQRAKPSSGPSRTRRRPHSSHTEDNAPPGFRTAACEHCGRTSRIRERIHLYSVICGGCGLPIRDRFAGRMKTRLRRADDRLERWRDRLIALLRAAHLPVPERKKENSSR